MRLWLTAWRPEPKPAAMSSPAPILSPPRTSAHRVLQARGAALLAPANMLLPADSDVAVAAFLSTGGRVNLSGMGTSGPAQEARRNPATVNPDMSAAQAPMTDRKAHARLVVDGGRPVGVAGMYDCLRAEVA